MNPLLSVLLACTVLSVQATSCRDNSIPQCPSCPNVEPLPVPYGSLCSPSFPEYSVPAVFPSLDCNPQPLLSLPLPPSFPPPLSFPVPCPIPSIPSPCSFPVAESVPLPLPIPSPISCVPPVPLPVPIPAPCDFPVPLPSSQPLPWDYPSPLPIRAPAPSPVIELPTPPAPSTQVISNNCVCTKTVIKPQLVKRVVSVPTIQRFLQKSYRPVVEKIPYSARPVNAPELAPSAVLPTVNLPFAPFPASSPNVCDYSNAVPSPCSC